MIQKLARELRAANSLNAELIRNAIRSRTRVAELERRFRPIGRVLMVDLPPFQEGIDYGAVDVYHDPGIDFCYVQSPLGFHDAAFDEALEWELRTVQERFRDMPWELGPRYQTTWTRWTTTWRQKKFHEFQATLTEAHPF